MKNTFFAVQCDEDLSVQSDAYAHAHEDDVNQLGNNSFPLLLSFQDHHTLKILIDLQDSNDNDNQLELDSVHTTEGHIRIPNNPFTLSKQGQKVWILFKIR